MQIGICVGHIEKEKMPEQFARLASENIHACQLVSWNPALWTTEDAEVIRCLLYTSYHIRRIYADIYQILQSHRHHERDDPAPEIIIIHYR